MHPLQGTQPVPYVPVRVTRGAVISHWYTYAPPRCRTSQYLMNFIPLSVSLWNDLGNSVFDGVGLAGPTPTKMYYKLTDHNKTSLQITILQAY